MDIDVPCSGPSPFKRQLTFAGPGAVGKDNVRNAPIADLRLSFERFRKPPSVAIGLRSLPNLISLLKEVSDAATLGTTFSVAPGRKGRRRCE